MAKLEKYQSYKSSWHPNAIEMVMSFNDDNGGAAGVYTVSCVIPAGSYLQDVQVHAGTLWDSGTSATLIVGTLMMIMDFTQVLMRKQLTL